MSPAARRMYFALVLHSVVDAFEAERSSTEGRYQYAFAASPDIIRSNQKDTYFQGVLLEQLSGIIRKLYGARFAHTYTTEARTFSDLLYLALTTLVGNRTLGEEYCDIVQAEDDTLRLPSIYRRGGYILTSVLLPYSLNRVLPAFRRRLRAKLEITLRKSARKNSRSVVRKLQSYLLSNLDAITSPSPIYAVSLATFYFSGAYYHLGKRLWGLRYIFTRRIAPSEQRVGYEVLGVLLVLQMAVQGWLHMHQTYTSAPTEVANSGSAAGGTAVIDGGVEVSLDANAYTSNNALLFETGTPSNPEVSKKGLEKITHTPVLSQPRYDLKDRDTMQWINGRQQRKCTLCLEEMKDPSVTTCGHVFCWTCIGDWCREKPECPLCRQMSLVQHILPLRG
ncbi:Pex12 amino terminal region-domain-containing protein [Cryomyces antarcticus]